MPEQDFADSDNLNKVVGNLSERFYKKIVNMGYSDFKYSKFEKDKKTGKLKDFSLPHDIASNLFLTLLEKLRRVGPEERKEMIEQFPKILNYLYKEAKRKTLTLSQLGDNVKLIRLEKVKGFYEKVRDLQDKLHIHEDEAKYIVQFDETFRRCILTGKIDPTSLMSNQNNDGDSDITQEEFLDQYKYEYFNPEKHAEFNELVKKISFFKAYCYKKWKISKSESRNIYRDSKIVLGCFFKKKTKVSMSEIYNISAERVGHIVSNSSKYILKCVRNKLDGEYGYNIVMEYL